MTILADAESTAPPTDPALCRVLEAMAPVLVKQFNSKLVAGERVVVMEVLVAMLDTAGAHSAANEDEEGTESETNNVDHTLLWVHCA